jgi:hypothetical protein
MILDIGPETSARLAASLKRAGTILWNGPVGVFEFDQFAEGTKTLALAIAASKAFSIAGGGDTVAAINKFGVAKDIGYISTAGGAFLEFLEGETPAVEAVGGVGGMVRERLASFDQTTSLRARKRLSLGNLNVQKCGYLCANAQGVAATSHLA